MSHPQGEHLQEQAQLLPTKATLTALKSDVTLESACLELCDNSLDAWKRTSDRSEPATIHIRVEEHDDRAELVIQDNTGGVPREQASMLFGLGRTAKAEAGGAIGTFGVGAKKSLVNLGVPFRITSRALGESTGWTYRIDEDWFEREEDWSVSIYDSTNLPPGVTEIRIEDLNYQWTEKTAERLRSQLGEAYNLFLSDTMQDLLGVDYDLTIMVDGEAVDAEGAPDWSYTPFDGLHPRRYENIRITGPDLDAPVRLHITVGILTKKDAMTAGVDIYCQGRKVATALRDGTGGFGSGTDQLGLFNARHERLKVLVELETNGDGRRLPWDTQKSSIDRHNLVMRGTDTSRGVYNWLRRIVQPYFNADADQIPRAFVEPYHAASTYAANNGTPPKHDFSCRERVSSNYRPNSDWSQIITLQNRIEAHTILGIQSTAGIPNWQIPAYHLQLKAEADNGIEDLTKIESTITKEARKEPHTSLGQINKLARFHFENGVRCSKHLAEWQKPSYRTFFEQHGVETVPAESTLPDGIPRTPEDISTDDEESDIVADSGPQLYSSQSIAEEDADIENAELFLVFSDGSDEERGAKVLDMTRQDLCKRFDLESTAGDDIVWEYVRHYLVETLSID